MGRIVIGTVLCIASAVYGAFSVRKIVSHGEKLQTLAIECAPDKIKDISDLNISTQGWHILIAFFIPLIFLTFEIESLKKKGD